MRTRAVAAPAIVRDEILRRNRLEYDDASDAYWRLTVYDAVHGGWSFANIGGRAVLESIAAHAGLDGTCHALELCCGVGDTCRYLASSRGCRVTGIEMNRQQIARASARLVREPRRIAGRVTFIEGDVALWKAVSDYDLVYAIDSLMLIDNRRDILRTARAALRPGGMLAFADVFATKSTIGHIRAFMLAEDGIINVPTGAEQRRMLSELGFTNVATEDLTSNAVACFDTIATATVAHARVLIDEKGAARYQRWLRNARVYRDWFRTRALEYGLITATWEGNR